MINFNSDDNKNMESFCIYKYDSEPPTSTTSTLDYGIIFGLSYKF